MKIKILLLISFSLYFTISKSQVNIDFIEKVQSYKETVKVSSTSSFYNDYIDTSTFNIKTYMAKYPALKMEKKRYIYDYYYYDNFLDGSPFIYIRPQKFNLTNYINKKANKINLQGKEREEFIRRSLYYFLEDSCNKANKNVFPEDTEEGFLQYLYFHEFGENFALKWHARNKKKHIIATKQEVEKILEQCTEQLSNTDTINDERGQFKVEIDDCDTTALQNYLLSDTIVSVQFNRDNVIVKWLESDKWGVFERTYRIMRAKPYHIELIDEKRLAKFQSLFIY